MRQDPSDNEAGQLAANLEAYLGSRFKDLDHVGVLNLTPLSNGWESSVYALTLDFIQDGYRCTRDAVVRVYEGAQSPLLPDRFRREHLHQPLTSP